jgi:uncharacterized metal-binding protein
MACDSSASRPRACAEGKRYVERHLEGPAKVAVLACEGACVKGEVARIAANLLAYRLEPERTVRICHGDALTADSGFRTLVERAPRVIAVEGCGLHCVTELVKARLPGVQVTPITASTLYEYDRTRCFEIFDMPAEELAAHARVVAAHVQATQLTGSRAAAPCRGAGAE